MSTLAVRRRPLIRAASLAAVAAAPLGASPQTLYGIAWDNGDLYRINPANASTTRIGATGVAHMADIQLGPDGFLYGFSTGYQPKTYRIDPATAATTELRAVGVAQGTFVYEGAMAQAVPDSYEFLCAGTNNAGAPGIFRLNVLTGAVADARNLAASLDINGWVYGTTDNPVLFGLDRESGKVQQIDPATGSVTAGDAWPGAVGEVGGMTWLDGDVFVATGGPGSVIRGSNSLYRTSIAGSLQEPVLVGEFVGIGGSGFSGIAAPEPSLMLAAAAAPLLLRRRRRQASTKNHARQATDE